MTTVETYELIATTAGLIATIPTYKGWFSGAISWNNQRKIDKLKAQKLFILKLTTSNREFLGWLLHSILMIATLLSAGLLVRSVEIDPNGLKLSALSHWFIGSCAYFFGISILGTFHRLKKHEETISDIDRRIQILEAKK